MTHQIDLFPIEYIYVHENNTADLFFLELLTFNPINQVSDLYMELTTRGVSIAECILTSNKLIASELKYKFEIIAKDFNIHTKNERMLEIVNNNDAFDHLLCIKKNPILFRNSTRTTKDVTRLMCECYLTIKDCLPLTEDFQAQEKLKKISLKIKKSLISDVAENIKDMLLINIEANKKIKISYLFIKNSLPKGIITNAKAIELAKEINQQANRHKRAREI